MAKSKSAYLCQKCGFESPKWLGKCPSCNEWNSFVEELISKEPQKQNIALRTTGVKSYRLSDIKAYDEARIVTGIGEIDRILGGGIVPGSLILLGGEPGIGKSTLALQLALKLNQFNVLYVSGEESVQQIKMRAERLGIANDKCYILAENLLENILSVVNEIKPGLVVIDSIQTLQSEFIESSPGSVSQIKECASQIQKFSKPSGIPFVIIGHITKDGSLAGPKVLEHIVDTVLQFEGDQHFMYRILRSAKNRFGSTSELGIFEMMSAGLKEVLNPSEILISHNGESLSGIAVAATIDGARPFLIETQALVSSAVYGTPQRSATGFDYRRLNMLLAVLEKRAGFRLGAKDVFLNIAGGLKVDDTAIDMAVISAILSSNFDLPLNSKYAYAAEIGLSGEIRPVSKIENRIAEAEKLGFEKIFVSGFNKKSFNASRFKIKIFYVNKVDELCKQLFG